MTPFTLLLTGGLSVGTGLTNPHPASVGYLLEIELLFSVPFSVLYGYGYCAWWRYRYRDTRYVLTDTELSVTSRGGAPLTFPRNAIISFAMRGRIDHRSFFTSLYPSPSLPRGVVRIRESSGAERVVSCRRFSCGGAGLSTTRRPPSGQSWPALPDPPRGRSSRI